jgi:hypothetical protein
MTNHIQTRNTKIKLLTEWERETQKVLFGNSVLVTFMNGENMSYLKMETVQEKAMRVFSFSKLGPLPKCSVGTELNI